MESGILTLIMTLFSNISVILLVLLYLKYRKKPQVTGTQLTHTSISSTLSKVYSTTITEISVVGGQDVFYYLSLLRSLCFLLLLYSVIALLSLIPIYNSETIPSSSSLSKLSIEGMQTDDLSYIIPGMCSIFFSIGVYFVAYMYYKLGDQHPELFPRFEDLQEEHRRQCTVMIYGIPKSFAPGQLEPAFKEQIERFSLGDVLSVHVVPEIKGMESLIKQKLITEKLSKNDQLLDNVNTEKVSEINIKFDEAKVKMGKKNSGYGFVLCKQPIIASYIISSFDTYDPMGVAMDKWKVKEAPIYADILWKNSPSSEVAGLFKKFLLNLLFIVVFLIFLTPVTLVGVVIGLLEDLSLPKNSTSFLAFSLPSIFTSLFYSIIIPLAIKYLIEHERHFLHSTATSHAFFKYFGYCLGILIIFPLLEAMTLESVIQKLAKVDVTMWNITLVMKIVKVGEFYLNFLLSMSLGSNFLDLAITNQYFLWDFYVYRKSFESKTAPVFDFAYEYSRVLIILCITLVFSISMPLVLPFGCLFMTVKYWLDKYNLLYVYRVEPGAGTHIQGNVMFFLLIATAVSQGINSGIFMAKGFAVLVYIGGFLSIACFLTVLYSFLIYKYRSPYNKPQSFEVTLKDQYSHPFLGYFH